MSRKLNIGIVGIGKIANYFHIPAINENKFCVLKSICDTDSKKLKSFKKIKNIAKYSNLETMLKNQKLDVLFITTPPNLHLKSIIIAAKYKCNIFVEKPFVLNTKEFLKAEKVLQKNKIKYVCGMHQRFRDQSKIIKNVIDKKLIGKVYYVRITKQMFRGIPGDSKVYSFKKFSGGGPIIDLGTHYFDLVCWLLNFPKLNSVFVKNYNVLSKKYKNRKNVLPFKSFDSEEFSTGIINFENGITINYEISYLLNVSKDLLKIEIYGDKGSISWPDCKIFYKNDKNKYIDKELIIKKKTKASVMQVNSFIDCVRFDRKTNNIKEYGFLINLIDKIYKAAKAKT